MNTFILTLLLAIAFPILSFAEIIGDMKSDKPSRRFEEFRKEREYPNGYVKDYARENAFRQMERMKHEKNSLSLMLAQQPQWKNIGPFNIGGRIKSVVIHPTNDNIVYAAAAAGGIWKTTNGGNVWFPVFDNENAISYGALAMDPENPDILYAATGEAVNNSLTYLGSGVYKTEDAGETWKLIGLTAVGAFSKIIVHPLNPKLIYAGGTKRAGGFYRSTDAGNTWEQLLRSPVTDVSINPNNQNEVIIGVDGTGIYRTTNGGVSWTLRNTNLDAGIGRISVQMAPSSPNIVYALVETNGLGYIYKSVNSGEFWGKIHTGDASFFNGQGFYNNYIMVHPTNQNVVFAGGIDLWRTINGATFTNMTNGYSSNPKMHVDQHCGAFFAPNPNIIYVGNDGGMYKSTDLGSTWRAINENLQVTQFYSIDIDHTRTNRNVGGTQDNGTQGNNNTDSWNILVGGDGFRVALDIVNPNILYGASTPGGRITPFKYNMQTGSFQYLNNGLNTNDNIWDPPIVLHPTVPDIIFHGRKYLYASFNGGNSWTQLSTGVVANNRYTAIAVSEYNEELMFAGTSEGDMLVSRDLGETWKNVRQNGLVNRWVKDIACSRYFDGTAYVVYSGFGTPHVFKTTNFGENWYPISSGLPDIPTNAIALHPENEDIIFIGTDIGVFATFDGGSSWLPYGSDMANAPVTALKFSLYNYGQGTYYLRAATHGRSMWEVPVTTERITSPEINTPIGGELYTGSTPQSASWYGFDEPVTVELSLDDGDTWRVIASNVVGSSLLWTVPTIESYLARIRVSSESNPSQIRTSNTFTIMKLQKGSILKEGGVDYVPYGIAWDGKDGLWSTSFYGDKIAKLNLNTFSKEKEFGIQGDSLFTDITMDRQNGILYVHKIGSTTQGGGAIIAVDTNGKFIRSFKSPADRYPTGITYVDGKLIVGDRDKKDEWDNKNFFIIDAITGEVEQKQINACQITYGPRCVAYDQSEFVYQVCTNFPNAGALTEAYIQKLPKNQLSNEIDRIDLQSLEGIINARGIEFDNRDNNIWITSFTGNIFKIAGFSTFVSVAEKDKIIEKNNYIETKMFPNPAGEMTNISFALNNSSGNLKIYLIDLMGRKLAKIYDRFVTDNTTDFISFKTAAMQSGVYNIVFELNESVLITRKLIITN